MYKFQITLKNNISGSEWTEEVNAWTFEGATYAGEKRAMYESEDYSHGVVLVSVTRLLDENGNAIKAD